jgi:hypothetical protein
LNVMVTKSLPIRRFLVLTLPSTTGISVPTWNTT